MKNALYEIVIYNGKRFITSHKLHEEVKPTKSLSSTNRSIRDAETYQELLENGHIVEVDMQTANNTTESVLASVIKSNGYNPIMLIDPVAQKALEHHFKETAPQAVQSSKENAALGLFGINISVFANNPSLIASLQALSKAEEAKLATERHDQEIAKINSKLEAMNGDTGYATIVSYAKQKDMQLPRTVSQKLGKIASEHCRVFGVQIGRVPDEHWGHVNSYPKELLDQIFQTTMH